MVVDVPGLVASSKKSVIHVLHVDDDPSIIEISKLMLMDLESSFEIENACCVNEALKKLSTGQYDIVISDYEMPQKDGLQLLTELRKQNNTIPFILFTGKGREEVAIKALNLGADGYYNKQGNPETVYGELTHGIKLSIERKKAKASMLLDEVHLQCMLEINKMLDASDQELMDYALEAITKITQSEFAFIDLLDPDETVMSIHSWSKTTMKECKTISKPIHCPVSEAGIWAEPIRQRKPVIIDDYSIHMPHKKGCPEGHVAIKNFLGVPVFERTHIVAIAAAANKKGCYDEMDVGNITALITDMWRLIQRKKTEDVLRRNEEKYRTLVEQTTQGIMIAQGPIPHIVFASSAMSKILGYSVQELTSLSPQQAAGLVHPDDRDLFFGRFRERLEGKSVPSQYVIRGIKKDGAIVWLELSSALVEYGGQPAVQAMFMDVTEHKKAEEVLRRSEERFRELANSLPEIVFEADLTGKITFFSKRTLESTGYTQEELEKGLNMLQFVVPEEQEKVKENLKKSMTGENLGANEYTLLRKNGSTYPALVRTTPIISENRLTGLRGIVIDITERKNAERTLSENQQKFKALFSANPDAALFLDTKFHVVEANSQFSTLFGYSLDELKGKIITDLIVPEESKDESSVLRQKILINPVEIVTKRIRKDGSKIPLLMSGGPVVVNDKAIGCIMVYKNISDIITVQEELSNALAKAEQLNEKLRIVGSLTRHDVGNKLMAARSNAYLLRKRLCNNPDSVKYLDSIDSALVSSDKIFDYSRLYEKIGAEKLSKQNVYECINQAAVLFQNLDSSNVVNECQGLEVMADSLLKQLFYNLIDNSLKHGEKVTQIRLYYTKDSDGAKMFYEDDGVGVPKANKSKLFEAGFTTGKGSGLGLYLVRKMMEVYGWTITEDGEPGKGAKFTITIPKLDKNGEENYQICESSIQEIWVNGSIQEGEGTCQQTA